MKKKSTNSHPKMKASKKISSNNVSQAVEKKVQEIKRDTKAGSTSREDKSVLFRHLAYII